MFSSPKAHLRQAKKSGATIIATPPKGYQASLWALTFFAAFAIITLAAASAHPTHQEPPPVNILAFYTSEGEPDHIDFAKQSLPFFADLAKKHNLHFESTTRWDDLNAEKLKSIQLVVWLNDFPHTPQQRAAFESYMDHGGAWLGFHVSAYNDDSTHWPWLVDFLGGAIFYGNNWPPLPAKLVVDAPAHPVTKNIPPTFAAPSNEWYIWKPSPRANKNVEVLLTLSPENFPLGLKDVITAGDVPVVWTNTRYHMLYMNMGHGDKIFTSSTQNQLFENAVLWLTKRP